MAGKDLLTSDPWHALRGYTAARIALGRAGGSLSTAALLDFQLAHARARDAVHLPFDAAALEAELDAAGLEALHVASAATGRRQYLQRPDLGRRLDDASRARLAGQAGPFDAVFVVGDGLSPLAAHRHAARVLALAHPALAERGWRIAPLVIAEQARVALGDEIGELMRASLVAVLIGERPGLSAADSLGVYLTHAPRLGRTDAERNCISNIHPDGGLDYATAAHKLVYLMCEARRRGLTGVALKDDSDGQPLLVRGPPDV